MSHDHCTPKSDFLGAYLPCSVRDGTLACKKLRDRFILCVICLYYSERRILILFCSACLNRDIREV